MPSPIIISLTRAFSYSSRFQLGEGSSSNVREHSFAALISTFHLKGVAEDLYRLVGGREAALLLLATVSSRGTERGTEEERSVRFSCARTSRSARAD